MGNPSSRASLIQKRKTRRIQTHNLHQYQCESCHVMSNGQLYQKEVGLGRPWLYNNKKRGWGSFPPHESGWWELDLLLLLLLLPVSGSSPPGQSIVVLQNLIHPSRDRDKCESEWVKPKSWVGGVSWFSVEWYLVALFIQFVSFRFCGVRSSRKGIQDLRVFFFFCNQ